MEDFVATTLTAAPEKPMLIGGEWVAGVDGVWTDVVSPGRRGTVLAQVPEGSAEDADRAVRAARAAFPAWRALHFKDRQKILLKIADALEDHAEELALLTAADTGNALRTQARPESQTLVNLFRYFGGVAGEFKGTVLPAGDDQLQYTRREPLGVVAGILPWNSPLMIAGMKTPAALAAGNTLVLKTAEDAPLTILRMAEIASEFLPPGVLNVVTGKGSASASGCWCTRTWTRCRSPGRPASAGTSPRPPASGWRTCPWSSAARARTSSSRTPRRRSASTPPPAGVLRAMRFTRQGQSCTAGSRLFVHADVYDTFMSALVEKVSALRVGDPLDEASDMGSIINAKQFESILGYIEDGKSQPGVDVALDGTAMTFDGLDGFYTGPTILGAVENSWRIAQEEIFGPVMVAIPWRDRDDVIAMANDSHYGLGAYIWSNNLTDALDTAHRVESGWVQVNQGGGQVIGQSYGGYKTSGIGREFSIEGALESFTQIKQINVKLG